jgi:hypothetical protein
MIAQIKLVDEFFAAPVPSAVGEGGRRQNAVGTGMGKCTDRQAWCLCAGVSAVGSLDMLGILGNGDGVGLVYCLSA